MSVVGRITAPPRYPSPSPRNMLPYVAKDLCKCDSDDGPWGTEITQDFQGELRLITWALKSGQYSWLSVSEGHAQKKEEKWGVRVSVTHCCWRWGWRKVAMHRGVQVTFRTWRGTSAGSQQRHGDLRPTTARDCIRTAICLSRRTDSSPELPEANTTLNDILILVLRDL